MKNLIYDPPLVFGFLEMRVRKEEKHFLELPLLEKIWQVLHCVRTKTGDVRVISRILKPQGANPVFDIV